MTDRKRKAEEGEDNASKRKANQVEEDGSGESELDDSDLELLQSSDDDEELGSDNDVGDEEDEDDEEGEDESDNEQFINNEVQIDFLAYDPNETDFHGIKTLLQRLWLKENVDLSGLANLLIEDTTVATVLKQEEDNEEEEDQIDEEERDDVYGLISLIPFNATFTNKECIGQIKNVLLSRIPKDNQIHKMLMDSKSACSLLINERFINLPPKISLPCYDALQADLKKQTDKDASYKFDHIIMVLKTLKEKEGQEKELIFVNGEDEVFAEAADASFEYSVADQCDSDTVAHWEEDGKEVAYEPLRRVLLLSRNKWLEAIKSLKDVV